MDPRRPYHDPAVYPAGTDFASTGTSFFKRISWGAIFAGTLLAIVLMLLLNLLGLGIGLAAVNPAEEASPFSGLGTGAIIWWVVSNLIAIFAGGYVAGKLAGIPLRNTSALHGILTWSLYTLVSFWILTTAVGNIISGVGSVLSRTISIAASGIGTAVSAGAERVGDENASISFSGIEREVRQVLSETGDPALQPDSIRRTAQSTQQDARQTLSDDAYVSNEDINNIIQDVLFEGGRLVDHVDRQDVVNVVVARTNLSRQEANNIADVIVRKHQEAKENWSQFKEEASVEARERGQQAAESASKAAIWSFVALFLGAVVGGAGGLIGKPHTHVVGTDIDREIVR